MEWWALPGDVLRLVAGRLHDPVDFLRLRAVCRSWRFASSSFPPPPSLPWLLSLSPHPSSASLSFFSLSSGVVHSIPTPPTAHLLGPTHSHLLLADHHLLLLNPLTGARTQLPPPLLPSEPIQGYISGPASPVVLYDAKNLCFYHPGGSINRWTELPVRDLVAENMYHEGKVFVFNDCGYVTIFDAVTLAEVGAVPPPPMLCTEADAFKCFVPSGDELLCVVRYFRKGEGGDIVDDCCGIEVHRLELELAGEGEASPPRWVRMRGIGDRMLFVGLYQGFSFRAADFVGYEGNCIYYFKLERAKRSCICRFSLEDGCIEELPGPRMHGGTWFVPSL